MTTRRNFKSPWSVGLTLITLVCLGALAIAVMAKPGLPTYALAAAVIGLTAAFMVRGYEVDGGRLLVRRLGWSKALELATLKSVEVSPEAMRWSWRIFGIGGLFSYVGRFQSPALGWFQAYATDPRRSVVLRFPSHNVVVTPDDPAAFTQAIRTATTPR